MLNKIFKSIKKVLQVLKSVRKSPPAGNLHHVKTSQSICNTKQTNWLQQTAIPKPDQNTINTYNFLIGTKLLLKLVLFIVKESLMPQKITRK